MMFSVSLATAQVDEQALQVQLELGSGLLDTQFGGYSALALTLEQHPAYLITARYQVELDQDLQVHHRPLLEARYQFNVLAVIPWVSLAGGALLDKTSQRFSWGGALGIDWRLNPAHYLSFSGRYLDPQVWTFGVAFGWRFILNDPFDP